MAGAVEELPPSSSASSPPPSSEVAERRGIPAAAFVEDVQTYLTQLGLYVNSTLSFLQERLQHYKLVEMKLLAQQRYLQAKILDIEKCLDVVATFQAKKGTVDPFVEQCVAAIRLVSCAKKRVKELCITPSVPKWSSHFLIVTTKALLTDFEVSEGIYSRARIDDADSVCLWLGANVMLEYSCEEVTIARVYNWDVHQRPTPVVKDS